ncbi:hypothetical protein J15TS10_44080 [Paenibacillus woosongensis]|uniref:Uncharacterized protein n=1 Tax=Paenibacillus woosongensis TaxID=307580 RepID=A0ABQ4MXC5_9BACL|nr:hypothetical protein J15TS10_44080 [Paenibacillus woosongensis]
MLEKKFLARRYIALQNKLNYHSPNLGFDAAKNFHGSILSSQPIPTNEARVSDPKVPLNLMTTL